jgi:methionyl aminopeptidase
MLTPARRARRHHRAARQARPRSHRERAGRRFPAPLNYAPPGYTPYPKSICTSINHQVCHGIPNDRPLKNGDIVNIDVTVIKDGWHGDTSRMFVVGKRLDRRQAADPDHLRGDVEGHRQGQGPAPPRRHRQRDPDLRRSNGFSIVREFCGHGIGARFHEEPQVLHYGRRERSTSSSPG